MRNKTVCVSKDVTGTFDVMAMRVAWLPAVVFGLCLPAVACKGADETRGGNAPGSAQTSTSHTEGGSSTASPRKKMFRCRKITVGPGVGRSCAGPGFSFLGVSDDDLFEVEQAWCITQRAAWTVSRSKMRCVPSQEECRKDLLLKPSGSDNLFARTDCTLTDADKWSGNEAPYSKLDGFSCEPNAKGVRTCSAFPVDVLPKPQQSSFLSPKAWCHEGPAKGMPNNLHCYQYEKDCVRERQNTGDVSQSECVLRDAAYGIAALDAVFGPIHDAQDWPWAEADLVPPESARGITVP